MSPPRFLGAAAGRVVIQTSISSDCRHQLRLIAASRDTTCSQLVRQAIATYFANVGYAVPKPPSVDASLGVNRVAQKSSVSHHEYQKLRAVAVRWNAPVSLVVRVAIITYIAKNARPENKEG